MPLDQPIAQDGNITVDGLGTLTCVRCNAGILQEAEFTGTVQTLSTGNTVTVPANTGVVRVTAAAAVTGIILPVGSFSGQMLTVIHEGASANTITYSTNVAGGTAQSGVTARRFVWDSVTALWYACL